MNYKIIYYAPRFYGYDTEIQRKIVECGCHVYRVDHSRSRLLNFLLSFLSLKYREKLFSTNLLTSFMKVPVEQCDLLFVIKGEYLQKNHIDYLKSRNNHLKLIMYQWDSIDYFDYRHFISIFDKVITFDFKDAKAYQLEYMPLFYLDDIFPMADIKEDIDLLFVATNAPWRYNYLQNLKRLSEKYGLTLYIGLKTPVSSFIKDTMTRKKYYSFKDIRFSTIKRTELISLYRRSKVFVDITNPRQTGLSMRIIEGYGMNKKLITSNPNLPLDEYVKEVAAINSQASDADILDFIKQPIKVYDNRQSMSINSWLKSLFDIKIYEES